MPRLVAVLAVQYSNHVPGPVTHSGLLQMGVFFSAVALIGVGVHSAVRARRWLGWPVVTWPLVVGVVVMAVFFAVTNL